MTMMLAPDLLDRRAIALLALVDSYGAQLTGPVRIGNDALRSVLKPGGRIALLDAPGFAAYTAAFDAPPAAPNVATLTLAIDLTPAHRGVLPRRITLRLPRKPNPAQRADADSLFQPVMVSFSASPRVAVQGEACILRVSVRRSGDGALVENALIRARSSDGKHTSWALTDPAGEAALVFPALPVSFPGPGGAPSRTIDCALVVHADPATVRFATLTGLASARAAAAVRTENHADPDAIAQANPANFNAAFIIPIAAGTQPAVILQWTAP